MFRFIFPIIGFAIALLVGVTIFGSVSNAVDCNALSEEVKQTCEKTMDASWTVLAILPIALFFIIFAMVGGITDTGLNIPRPRLSGKFKTRSMTSIQKIMIFFGLAKVKKTE